MDLGFITNSMRFLRMVACIWISSLCMTEFCPTVCTWMDMPRFGFPLILCWRLGVFPYPFWATLALPLLLIQTLPISSSFYFFNLHCNFKQRRWNIFMTMGTFLRGFCSQQTFFEKPTLVDPRSHGYRWIIQALHFEAAQSLVGATEVHIIAVQVTGEGGTQRRKDLLHLGKSEEASRGSETWATFWRIKGNSKRGKQEQD